MYTIHYGRCERGAASEPGVLNLETPQGEIIVEFLGYVEDLPGEIQSSTVYLSPRLAGVRFPSLTFPEDPKHHTTNPRH